MKYDAVEVCGEGGKVVHVIEFSSPKGLAHAEKVDDGVNRNLDHERFFTRLREAK